MKIGGLGSFDLNPYKKVYSQSKQTKNLGPRLDKVEISLEALEKQGQSSEIVSRQDKVKRLQEQVQNGTYEVDTLKVAKKLNEYFSQK